MFFKGGIMKIKQILTIQLLFFGFTVANVPAASKKKKKADSTIERNFTKGDFYIGPAIGLGAGYGTLYGGYIGGYAGGPVFLANIEYAVTDEVGIGISGGYSSWKQDIDTGTYFNGTNTVTYTTTYSYTAIPIVANFSYHWHWWGWFKNWRRFDWTFGVSLGWGAGQFEVTYSRSDIPYYGYRQSGNGFLWSLNSQWRYYVTNSIVAHIGFASGVALVSFGVDFRI